jgi:hypothetical protein
MFPLDGTESEASATISVTKPTGELAVTETKEPEPSARKRQDPKDMTIEDLVSAFGLATRLRAHEVEWKLDASLQMWLEAALRELDKRGELELVREHLPVYYDPSRRQAVFGPGAKLAAPAGLGKGAVPRALKPAG